MKNVTLKDVAKAAGVSYAPCPAPVRESPDQRRHPGADHQAVRRDGYTTNYVARSMVMKKTDLIGLVVPAIDNEFMSQMAYYAEMSARSHVQHHAVQLRPGPEAGEDRGEAAAGPKSGRHSDRAPEPQDL